MNSVLRLANSLDRLKMHNQGNVADAWAALLKVPNPSEDFFTAMTIVYVNHAEASLAISDSDLSERAKNLYMGAVQKVAQFCNPSVLTQIPATHTSQEHASIDMLFLAGETLPNDEVKINPITFETLIKQVVDLLNDLEALEIDAQLKSQLISLLKTFVMALRSYEIFGVAGLSKIYGSVSSEIARLGNQPLAKTAPAVGWFSKTRSALKTIGAAVIWTGAVVGGAHELITDGSEILGLTSEVISSDDDAQETAP